VTGARVVIVGVDGLDFDVVASLPDELADLKRIVAGSSPHSSVFPPDSVPSWTTILTGLRPEEHRQMSNVQYFLDSKETSAVTADVNRWSDLCFWEGGPSADVAVINPFLAYPPWSPNGGAMVSGHPFEEGEPSMADPRSLLNGERPPRMGGFTKIPEVAELGEFVDETLAVGQAQYDYALRQLRARRWDVFFFTSLVIDRLEHYTWRAWDREDPVHLPKGPADAIPRAHAQLNAFLREVTELLGPDDRVVVASDHGHGRRASIGVNLNEYLRRLGLYRVSGSSVKRRAVEFLKTAVYSAAPRLRAEDFAIRLARRMPNKKALKSGSYVGSPSPDSAFVVDLAGSNPFGGIRCGIDVQKRVIAALEQLTYRGRPVVRWVRPAVEVIGEGASGPATVYPDLLFELEPAFGPTWNLYGPLFAPVLTRRRQSGGHTRRGVAAAFPALPWAPQDSLELNRILRQLVSD
jgi:hypothetical protein